MLIDDISNDKLKEVRCQCGELLEYDVEADELVIAPCPQCTGSGVNAQTVSGSGVLDYPNASDVKAGISYGSSGTAFTGTFVSASGVDPNGY